MKIKILIQLLKVEAKLKTVISVIPSLSQVITLLAFYISKAIRSHQLQCKHNLKLI